MPRKNLNEPLLVVAGDLGPLLTGRQNSGTPGELLIESALTPEVKSFIDKVIVPALVREYLNRLPTGANARAVERIVPAARLGRKASE